MLQGQSFSNSVRLPGAGDRLCPALRTDQFLQVLVRLPQLRVLDGQDVTASELEAANGIVRHESAVLTLMLANACLAHKMVSSIELSLQSAACLQGIDAS